MNRKRNLWVVVATLALVMAVIPGASADPVGDGVGSVDPSTGIWHLSTGLSANLTGAAEVPGPGDPNATGSAHLNLDADSGEVCFAITHKNVDGTVVAAHIHEGGTDVSGGVVIDLEWSTTGGTGCVTADPGAVAAVSAEPSGYYVNVHSTIFPAGAIRGQLQYLTTSAVPEPETYALMLGGLGIVGWMARRRRQS